MKKRFVISAGYPLGQAGIQKFYNFNLIKYYGKSIMALQFKTKNP